MDAKTGRFGIRTLNTCDSKQCRGWHADGSLKSHRTDRNTKSNTTKETTGAFYQNNSRKGSNQQISASKMFSYAVNKYDNRNGMIKSVEVSGVPVAEAEAFVASQVKTYGVWFNIVRWNKLAA